MQFGNRFGETLEYIFDSWWTTLERGTDTSKVKKKRKKSKFSVFNWVGVVLILSLHIFLIYLDRVHHLKLKLCLYRENLIGGWSSPWPDFYFAKKLFLVLSSFTHLLWSGFGVVVFWRRVGFLGLRPVLRGLLGFFCAQTIWAHRGINLGINMVHESFIIYFVVDGEWLELSSE